MSDETPTPDGDTTDVFVGVDPIYANIDSPARTPGPIDDLVQLQIDHDEACRAPEIKRDWKGNLLDAADDDDDDADAYDPADYSVEEVLGYVEQNPEERDAILEAELDGKNRSTLVDPLSESE